MRNFKNSLLILILLQIIIGFMFSSCNNDGNKEQSSDQNKKKDSVADDPFLSHYPEKAGMILLTDRPPQLETPLKVLRKDITPNESFFVRWHLSNILREIDVDTFRLVIDGDVDKPLSLSMNDLKTKFKPCKIIALAECAGNSRSLFKPQVPGSQWVNGGMGNAEWTGVKVKDILEMAGIKKNVVDISFDGLDEGPLPGVPDFVKSLSVAHAMDDEVMIAYQMNGKDIPMLNGFPLKLVVPGWYATYWVGALHKIEVLNKPFDGFWMKKAYLAPDNPQGNEKSDSLSKKMVPVTTLALHSIFVEPEPDAVVPSGKPCLVEGLAFDGGIEIKKVELSMDNGATWIESKLDPEISKYSWRRWRYNWTPSASGTYHLKVKATNAAGETQSTAQWNRSGYGRTVIETLDVTVK